jgi:hypothetical protein
MRRIAPLVHTKIVNPVLRDEFQKTAALLDKIAKTSVDTPALFYDEDKLLTSYKPVPNVIAKHQLQKTALAGELKKIKSYGGGKEGDPTPEY